MRSKLFNISLITLVIGGLIAQAFISDTATARGDNPNYWDEPVKFTQPAKPKPGRRRPISRPKPDKKGLEENPLLTIKYQVLTRDEGGAPQQVDASNREFKVGEQVKLAFTPNQRGFLYVVHHSIDNNNKIIDQPHVIFPSPRINDGKNDVKKDEAYTVPKYCPEFENPDDCWFEITPPSGRDFFTVIFSRDEIVSLPSRLTDEDVSNNAKDAVALKFLDDIKKSSDTKDIVHTNKIAFSSRRSTESDGTYVQNTSKKDNEDIIDTIELRHPSEGGDSAVARTRALFVKKRSDAMKVLFQKDGRDVDPSTVFKANETVEVKYESNFNGYIYMVNITPGGQKFLIFPCTRMTASNLIPGRSTSLPVSFDEEKGTEVLQVIMSRDRIDFLESAIKDNCCENPGKCQLSGTASSAAAELAATASKQQKGGITVANVAAVVPDSGGGGIRARGISLAQGKDKNKGSAYVAIDNPGDNKLEAGRYAVFEIRLNHN